MASLRPNRSHPAPQLFALTDRQHVRFELAEMSTEIDIAQAYVDRSVLAYNAGRCLQLHGGYGYMTEYPVARAYLDTRIQTIYGGTAEIMEKDHRARHRRHLSTRRCDRAAKRECGPGFVTVVAAIAAHRNRMHPLANGSAPCAVQYLRAKDGVAAPTCAMAMRLPANGGSKVAATICLQLGS